ncbi:SUF system Fe-S cluster assembly regulator [Roseomonas sp. KE0001]|uniref:SUF system Fe-S cluster assembly regulator n=1 Tax=unclassified Roseomonas TaxID=2617492 RepID=UPI0018DFE0F3|nr:SUF system Fe-S cluster assembly regulator [Roseomonas sp. KE0001]
MLRLSKLTDYAVVVLSRLEAEGGVQTAPGLAAATGIAEPTVAKVLKTLGHSGLVEGLRGARGGYRLARPLSAMPLSEVIVAIDGPIALTACVDGASGGCEAEAVCPVRGRWDPVNEAIRAALSSITLADLAVPRAACSAAPPARPRPPAEPARSYSPAQPARLPAHSPAAE